MADISYTRTRQRIKDLLEPLGEEERTTVAALIGRFVSDAPVSMAFVDEVVPAASET